MKENKEDYLEESGAGKEEMLYLYYLYYNIKN